MVADEIRRLDKAHCYANQLLYISTLHVSLKILCRSQNP